MKKIYTILNWIVFLLLGLSANSYAQLTPCSGRFTLEYPNGSGTSGAVPFNNGSGNVDISYCPSGTVTVNVKVVSESAGTFTFSATGYSESHLFTSTEVSNNTSYTFTLPNPNSPTTSTVQLNSSISCNNTKNSTY